MVVIEVGTFDLFYLFAVGFQRGNGHNVRYCANIGNASIFLLLSKHKSGHNTFILCYGLL